MSKLKKPFNAFSPNRHKNGFLRFLGIRYPHLFEHGYLLWPDFFKDP